jgi:hypothetical protein
MKQTRNDLKDDIDSLFQLPLAEFIGARKELAARLKKAGRADDSERVKLLAKPPVSAWTVNQLYWQHREQFDLLLATGQRFRKAQTSGKVADMRAALSARTEALSRLENLATSLLQNAGHNPTPDMIRRITTTLEAVSAYDVLPDGSSPGRMTKDVDPPGFETMSSFVAGAAPTKRTEPARAASTGTKTKSISAAASQVSESRVEQQRQAKLAAAKIALANAKKALTDARTKAQSLETNQKKIEAVAKQAEKQRSEAEARFKKALAAADEATEHAGTVRSELEEATRTLADAKRSVEKATEELESLFRDA